jgi:excisionase family DNA binding protein
MKDIMTITEVADYLNVPYGQIFNLIHGRSLPAFRVGKHWRIKKDDLEKWVEAAISNPFIKRC